MIAQPIDILPTLCELAGAAVEAEHPMDGLSFAKAVRDGSVDHRRVAVSGCHVGAGGAAPPRKAVTPFLVTDRWGYAPVGALGRPELYDLSSDPLATSDVAAENGELLSELRDEFLSHLAAHGASKAFLSLWRTGSGGSTDGGAWAIDY